jgi:hypothetical protein
VVQSLSADTVDGVLEKMSEVMAQAQSDGQRGHLDGGAGRT